MYNFRSKSHDRNESTALVAYMDPKSAMSEAFRGLRTNLNFAGLQDSIKTVLITSALPEEGKSIVAANLAVVTAQAGYRVILVDCDLRKPVQHKIFGIPNNNGVTNCIFNDADPDKTAFNLALNNLKLLNSGPIPPNPAEIVNSERTRNLWSNLKSRYDYIFIDSPPLLAVTDASILASQVDGCILVVRSGVTRNESALQARDSLRKANARILGVVLNRVKMDKSHEYYY